MQTKQLMLDIQSHPHRLSYVAIFRIHDFEYDKDTCTHIKK